jgi:Tol biopolymer transport system component/DNA-binding winged helix-turn-helix (wHTH) protein
MEDNVQERVRFGPFVADVQTHELWREGVRIKLMGQPFEILAVFLAKPGKLVTREELRSRLWQADTFVDFNHGLNAAMNKLREALCDSADDPRYIETLPRRGYRFIAKVERLNSSEAVRGSQEAAMPMASPELIKPPVPVAQSEQASNVQVQDQEIFDSFKEQNVRAEVEASVRKRSFWTPALVTAGLLALVVFSALLWFFLEHQDQPEAKEVGRRAAMQPVLLTDLADPTTDPALSPDGTRVAFRREGYAPGNSGIFVKQIGSQQLWQLTNNRADCCPAWSPNGRTIAFSRFTDKQHEIYTVSATGGGLVKLYSTGLGPKHGELDWSPDGSDIAFVGESPQGSSSIFLLSKREAHRISEPAPLNRDWGPAFSPDGQSLSFVRTTETGLPEKILVMPSRGGESRAVVTFYNGILGPPAWTRDGQSLIFASGGEPVLLRAPVFGGDRVTDIKDAGSPVWHPATARQSDGLAFQRISEAISVWELNPAHPNQPHGVAVSESGRNEGAQLSPDGKKLAFMSSRTGSLDLWVSNRDGSSPVQVTAMGDVGSPRWSPDSRSIAFDVGWRHRGTIFVVDLAGGSPRPLAQGDSDNLVPNWSRDGKWVLFASNRSGIWQVWKMPVAGGPAVQVTVHGGFAAYPSFDGNTIYYSKTNLPQTEVWQVPTQGGVETLVTQVRPESWASWAPTEKGIYFLAANSRPDVMFFDFATSGVSKVATLDKIPFWLTATEDGSALFYEHLDQENSHIMMLKNFQ